MDGSDCLTTLYIQNSGSTCLADGPPTKTNDLGMANHLNLLDCEAIIAGFNFDRLFQKVMNAMVMNWPYMMQISRPDSNVNSLLPCQIVDTQV